MPTTPPVQIIASLAILLLGGAACSSDDDSANNEDQPSVETTEAFVSPIPTVLADQEQALIDGLDAIAPGLGVNETTRSQMLGIPATPSWVVPRVSWNRQRFGSLATALTR